MNSSDRQPDDAGQPAEAETASRSEPAGGEVPAAESPAAQGGDGGADRRLGTGRPLVLLLVGTLLGWAVAAAVLFLWPHQDVPRRADAVVVLAGGKAQRLARGLALVEAGVAPTLVISDGWDPTWPEANRLCARRSTRFRVICFKPRPYSTRGEARGVARLELAHRWRSVLLVTSRYHVLRSRLLFERCLGSTVSATGAPWPRSSVVSVVVKESAKLGYAVTVGRSC